ncbi:hypothetical protein HXX76_015051 [Chlamydomonas incerta]|uniref:F-box domain-containing protein n=1 Tax=Chlamydomonas incerta TaxID=51695 RepID=A0A835VQ92_CHLIN|nr:hypothetical protein HXX76_015051 [Chlamydomonas incerta]|eukprot:KAG2423775.1 hypothetical protein HXX76_015051 [Chlamydomonas incerta]
MSTLPELLRVLPPDARQKVLGDSFSSDMAACRAACRELRQLCDDAVSLIAFDVRAPARGALGAARGAQLFPFTRLALQNVMRTSCVADAGLPAAVRQRLSGITITPSDELWPLDYAAIVDALANGPLRLPALQHLAFQNSLAVNFAAPAPARCSCCSQSRPPGRACRRCRCRGWIAWIWRRRRAGWPLTHRSVVAPLSSAAALQALGRLSGLEALSFSCLTLPRAPFRTAAGGSDGDGSGGGGGSDPALLQRLMARDGLPRLRRLRLSTGWADGMALELEYEPGLGGGGGGGWGIAAVRLHPSQLAAARSRPPPPAAIAGELHRLDAVAALLLGAAEALGQQQRQLVGGGGGGGGGGIPRLWRGRTAASAAAAGPGPGARGSSGGQPMLGSGWRLVMVRSSRLPPLPARARAAGAATLEALRLEEWLEEELGSCYSSGIRTHRDLLPLKNCMHAAAPAAGVLLLDCDSERDASALAAVLSASPGLPRRRRGRSGSTTERRRWRCQRQRRGASGGSAAGAAEGRGGG